MALRLGKAREAEIPMFIFEEAAVSSIVSGPLASVFLA